MTRQDVQKARLEASSGPRTQKTFYLTREVVARVNAATYWARASALSHAQGEGAAVNVDDIPDSASALVEAALWAEVLRLEETYNGGKPWPPAPGKLRPGPGQSGAARMAEGRKSE